jgi:hypothetical protein
VEDGEASHSNFPIIGGIAFDATERINCLVKLLSIPNTSRIYVDGLWHPSVSHQLIEKAWGQTTDVIGGLFSGKASGLKAAVLERAHITCPRRSCFCQ